MLTNMEVIHVINMISHGLYSEFIVFNWQYITSGYFYLTFAFIEICTVKVAKNVYTEMSESVTCD